jgi:broad specificity phosphatase PhoE
MALIYLIRHGKAAASFTDDVDPGLDATGRLEAETACKDLESHLPLDLLSSPLKRAQETAEPLIATTQQNITIEPRVAEIPYPGLSLEERGPWLQQVMAGNWSEQAEALKQWRESMHQCLLSISKDTAIFSHFVAINVALGLAVNSDEVLLFRPGNGSITVLDNAGGELKLVRRGNEAMTKVN